MAEESIDEILDPDNFFYYGEDEDNVGREILHDIAVGVMQPRGELFFFRDEGTTVVKSENIPNTIIAQVLIRAFVAKWIGFRNTYVNDGKLGGPDRRSVSSQTAIRFKRSNNPIDENLDMQVGFIAFSDATRVQALNIPVEL